MLRDESRVDAAAGGPCAGAVAICRRAGQEILHSESGVCLSEVIELVPQEDVVRSLVGVKQHHLHACHLSTSTCRVV